MKNFQAIFISLLINTLSHAQEFKFEMYFEDAVGDKDTLVLGYDKLATELVDTFFSEQNIQYIPLKSGLDVRVSDALQNEGEPTFQLKNQIVPDSCHKSYPVPVIWLDLKTKHWPVTAHWNNELFKEDCRIGSLITSFHPGGWFDVGGFSSNLGRVDLAKKNQVTFTSNVNIPFNENYGYINTTNDTISVFWLAFIDSTKIHVADVDLQSNIISYPNPVKDLYTIQSNIALDDDVELVDICGRIFHVKLNQNRIDLSFFSNGIYNLLIREKTGRIINRKIIKL